MGRHPSRDLIIVAQLTGVAAVYAQAKRCTRDDALAEIGAILGSTEGRAGRRADLLATAASLYVEPPTRATWWHSDALALLTLAGADPDRAAAINHERRRRSAGLVL